MTDTGRPAGRELDLLIAEKVMGLEVIELSEPRQQRDPHSHPYLGGFVWPIAAGRHVRSMVYKSVGFTTKTDEPKVEQLHDPAKYSTDIAAAWLVVEKLQSLSSSGDIHIEALHGEWSVSTCLVDGKFSDWAASSKFAPHAICLAALKAVGI